MEVESECSESLRRSIEVEAVGPNVYRAVEMRKPRTRSRAVYGGQTISQALMAAVKSVTNPDFFLHSCHCYFLSPIKEHIEILYNVDISRDGRTFASRSVKATQEGKVVFQCLVLFRRGENGISIFDHSSFPMPSVPHPDGTGDSDDSDYVLAGFEFDWLAADMHMCQLRESLGRKTSGERPEPRRVCWAKGKGGIPETDHQNVHRIALSYLSDLFLASAIIYKYPEFKPGFVTSLDHSIWFHKPLRGGDWFLMVTESELAEGESSLNVVRMYAGDGSLVATCKQESLIRPKL